MKRKTKVVCGTGEGSLITFNTGDYSMFNDEFPCVDKGAVVNKLVPVTENILISALDNGKIRYISLITIFLSMENVDILVILLLFIHLGPQIYFPTVILVLLVIKISL